MFISVIALKYTGVIDNGEALVMFYILVLAILIKI
jgi:hypothetical protein